MMRYRLCIAATLVIAGCQPIETKTIAPDVHIAPECLTACYTDAPLITDDPQSIVAAAVTERAHLKHCESKRELCAQALQRAQDAGAIK